MGRTGAAGWPRHSGDGSCVGWEGVCPLRRVALGQGGMQDLIASCHLELWGQLEVQQTTLLSLQIDLTCFRDIWSSWASLVPVPRVERHAIKGRRMCYIEQCKYGDISITHY